MTKLITKILLIFCMMSIFFSCKDIYEEIDKSENIHLSFVLSLGDGHDTADNYSETRGTQSRIIGNDYEGQIDANDFYVVIYDANNQFIAQLKDINIFYTGIKDLYEFVGNTDFPESKLNSTCKIMVFANCGKNINKDTKIGQLSFDYSKNTFNEGLENRHLIPMWGIKTIDNFNIKKGERLELGKINLLRAMAKVEVSLDPKVKNFTLQSVTLANCYDKGLVLPYDYNNIKELADDYTVNNVWIPNNTTLHTLNSISFYKKSNKKYIIYVPEFDNNNIDNTNKSSINVRIKFKSDNSTKDYTIDFKNYLSHDTPTIDILRNTNYKFNITGISESIRLYYKIENWGNHTVDIPAFD